MRLHKKSIVPCFGSCLALCLIQLLAIRPASAAANLTVPSPQTTPPQSGAPTLQVYSRETVVDVTVTDDKGQPVHGLTAADFTVKEDAKPQTIRSLKETSAEIPSQEPTARTKLPPDVYSNVHAAPATGPVNILLLDALNTSDGDLGRMKRETIKYLRTMPPGTQIAVFVLSPSRGLRMLQTFTSDGAAAAASVDRMQAERFRHHPLPTPRMTVESMQHIAAYVAGIKGRKNLLWFTAYMPIAIVRDGGYRDGTPPALVSFREISKLYEAFTAEQVAVYPINAKFSHDTEDYFPPVPGIHTQPVSDSDNPPGTAPNQLFLPDEVADGTGGIAYGGPDLSQLIAKAVENGRSFYTLSYVPPQFATDTRYHTIDIKVDRPGLHVVYRKGFNAEDVAHDPPTPGPKLMQAAMGGGAPPATQLLFDVRVQPTGPAKPNDPPLKGTLDPKRRKLPLTRYNFLYLLPMSQIVFTDGPAGTHSGSLEFDIAAYDADDKLATMLSQTMKLPLTADEYQQFIKTPFRFLQQLGLPPGQFTLRLGILDGVSNKVGTLEIPLTVAKDTPQRASSQPRPTR